MAPGEEVAIECPMCHGEGVLWRTYKKQPNHAGSVYQRSEDGRWVAALRVDGERRIVYGKTRREAERKLKMLRRVMGAQG